ncbi:GAF sensor signal transduction histidine kinase [Geitlerinema sp. PCC 7407]|nr:GAF sensor signal transduction histidine kinase [Geitlerinema sp. PCC 7407]
MSEMDAKQHAIKTLAAEPPTLWSAARPPVGAPAYLASSAPQGAMLCWEVTRILTQTAHPKTALYQVAELLRAAFRADVCTIVERHWLKSDLHATADRDSHLSLDTAPILAAEALEDLFVRGGPLVMNAGEDLLHTSTGIYPVRSLLAVVTRLHGQVNGAIVLATTQDAPWGEEERVLLQMVADAGAIALSQMQLQHQVFTLAQHQSLIDQLTMAVRNSSDFDRILRLALNGLARSLQLDRGFILLLRYSDPLFKQAPRDGAPATRATLVCEWLEQEMWCESASWCNESSDAPMTGQSLWLSECSLCQHAFELAPQPIVVAHPSDLTDVIPADSIAPLFRLSALPALILVPLMGSPSSTSGPGTVLGFVVLQSRQPRLWEPEELTLVELVGAHISTAIIQTQTLRQVQALVEERTAQLQRSLAVQAKLYEKTRQQIEQLRHLNQVKDEFVSTMNHELRTPLTSMSLAIRMLRQPDLPEERRTKYLNILEAQCNQETNLINDLLALQHLESQRRPIQIQRLDLKQTLGPLVEAFEGQWAEKGLSLVLSLPERSLQLETEPDSLLRILTELLNNAGKYSRQHTTIALDVQAEPACWGGQNIVLSVTNVGHGIGENERSLIFEKFWRCPGVTDQAIPGTGLGLALVKCLVHHINGAIAVESQPLPETDAWQTRFTLTLPQTVGNSL